jgi:hypothetical protein
MIDYNKVLDITKFKDGELMVAWCDIAIKY